MPLIDHFSLIAPLYDRVAKPPDAEHLRNLARLPVEGRLLDVGGGTGRISFALKSWVTGVVVADSSFGMLAQAKMKEGLTPVGANAEQLPFPGESFERVIMVDALHHVWDYHWTLAELWRVLKPGGRIMIEEPDIRALATKIMALFEKLALMRSHVISPIRIKGQFAFPEARAKVTRVGMSCWVIIDKVSDNRS